MLLQQTTVRHMAARRLAVRPMAAKGFGAKAPAKPSQQPAKQKKAQQPAKQAPKPVTQPNLAETHVQMTAEDVQSIAPTQPVAAGGYTPLEPGSCTCCSGKAMSECCVPILDGRTADTPEATARARFSAFCSGVDGVGYILSTTHRDFLAYHYEGQSTVQAHESLLHDVQEGCSNFDYTGFTVTQVEPGSSPDEGFVAFSYRSSKRDPAVPLEQRTWATTQEKGRFLRVDGVWQFVDYQRFQYDPTKLFAAPPEVSGAQA